MTTAVPGLGDILYLCSAAIQLGVEATTTFPDTPNQYSARLNVMSDLGDMNLAAIQGKRGRNGQAVFALRDAVRDLGYDPVSSPIDLPELTDTTEDIGKYWLIDTLDGQGHILEEWCYVWWGTYYRQIMMGKVGAPGSVPNIHPLITQVAPTAPPKIIPTGSTLFPTWNFNVPSPAGPPGVINAMYGFPDVNEIITAPPSGLGAAGSGSGGTLPAGTYYYVVTAVNGNGETTPSNEVSATTTGSTSKVTLTWTAAGLGNTLCKIYRGFSAGAENVLIGTVSGATVSFVDTGIVGSLHVPPRASVLAFTGTYTAGGLAEFTPFDVEQYLPQTYSMPTSAFNAYVGIAQQAAIGQFSLPNQPFPWTPLTWGHLCAGASVSGALMIGAQVLLNNPTSGQQIGRGFGNTLGEVNISPHYSNPSRPNANITPKNGMAVIQPSVTGLAALGSTSGGTLAAGTYYYMVTPVAPSGERPPSNEAAAATTGSSSSVTLNWIGITKATSYNIYRGTGSGGENKLIGTTTGTTFTDTGTAGSTASPPPPTTLYVNLYNDGQLGFYNFWPSPAPSPLQQFLNDLSNALGHTVANINNVIGLLEAWPGQITQQIQTQLNAVANMVGSSAGVQFVEASLSQVGQFLQGFGQQVVALADALGLGALINDLDALVIGIETFASSITSAIQNAIDSVANSFGLPGVGHTTNTIAAQISGLAPSLQMLADLLGGTSVNTVIGFLNSFAGSVTTDIQNALNGVAGALNASPIGQTINGVKTILTDFQSSVDDLVSELGGGAGATIGDLIGLLEPWVVGGVTVGIQAALDALAFLLGLPGVGTLVTELISLLMPLLGDIFSGFTTPAQLFVLVTPMLQQELTP